MKLYIRLVPLVAWACLITSNYAVADEQDAIAAYEQGRWEDARKEFESAADEGSSSAMYSLGVMYMNGNGMAPDMRRAHTYWKKGASLGHVESMYNLAVTYKLGDGVEKDYHLAARWFREAAMSGHEKAGPKYVGLYDSDQSPNKREVLESLARRGISNAAYRRGLLETSARDRWKWFELASKSRTPGSAYAEYGMADILWEGGLGHIDKGEAIRRYKVAAEDPIEPYATRDKAIEIGHAYRLGTGVKRDPEAAIWWYRIAETKGWSADGKIPKLIHVLEEELRKN